MIDTGTPNISEPVPHKMMWDALQDMQPKTRARSFILTGNGKNLELRFAERVLEFSELYDEETQDCIVAPEQQGQ